MDKSRTVITVDGLAGSGKTTLARELAKKLGFAHLNTGLLYRSVGYLARKYSGEISHPEALVRLLRAHPPHLTYSNENGARLVIDGIDITDLVAAPEISELTSKTASLEEVRSELLASQQEAFPGWNIVAEGRDMGTVVFPHSPVKFFVQAAAETRALRRISQLYGDIAQLTTQERAVVYEKIKVEINERDHRDSTRQHSPTIAAVDSIIIDNTSAPLTEVVQKMYNACLSRGII